MPHVFATSKNHQGQIAEKLGLALGAGLGTGVHTYYANKALEDVVNDEEIQGQQQSTRLGKLQQALAPYGKFGQEVFQNRLQIEQQAQQEQEQNVLSRIMSGEKISQKDYASLSPKTQAGLIRYQQQQEEASKKINTDTLASDAFAKGYKGILENDSDALKEVITDPNVPLNVKKQLSDIQNQFSTRNDVKAREVRNRVNSVQSAYAKAISAERNKIGKIGGVRKHEVEEINKRIDSLEKARQKDMQKLLKNPEEYGSLSIWGNEQMKSFLPEGLNQDTGGQEDVQEKAPQHAKNEKIRLALEDERRDIARQLLRKHGGDKKAAMEEFEERYE